MSVRCNLVHGPLLSSANEVACLADWGDTCTT